MSILDSAAVTNRANRQAINIELILRDTSLSTPARMTLIAEIAEDYLKNVSGSIAHLSATKEAERYKKSNEAIKESFATSPRLG